MSTPQNPTLTKRETTIARLHAAAAQIIADEGITNLTHRAVAARAECSLGTVTKYLPSIAALRAAGMSYLATQWDADIDHIVQALATASAGYADPRSTESRRQCMNALAERMHQLLRDPAQVKSECSLVGQGLFDEALRDIGLRWYEKLNEALTPYISPVASRAITEYFDGALMMAGITGTTPTLEHVTAVLNAIAAIDSE